MTVNLIFHPLNFKKHQKIYFDKRVEIFSFPVKHSVPTCGFIFREIEKQPNIRKELVTKYNIPIAKIKAIKAGADFTGADASRCDARGATVVDVTWDPDHPRPVDVSGA